MLLGSNPRGLAGLQACTYPRARAPPAAAPVTYRSHRHPLDLTPSPAPLSLPPGSKLRYLVGLHPFTGIAALSPHVAQRVSAALGGAHVHWMLPTLAAACGAGCAEGFAVQGK